MPNSSTEAAPTEEAQKRLQIRRRRDFALIITNLGKLAGLVAGVLEATSPNPNKASLIFFGFLILGVQRAEELLLNAIDRVLGK